MSKCQHGRHKNGYYCKDCKALGTGGKGICEHNQRRAVCKECKKLGIGGKGICEHNMVRNDCRDCDGSTFCEHKNRKDGCKDCKKLGKGGGLICDHNNRRQRCRKCKELGIGGSAFCEHNNNKSLCKKCKELGVGGGSYCEHKNYKPYCKDCKALGIGGNGLCEHDLPKSSCKQCKGKSICEHENQRSQCPKCREALPIGECLTRYKHACVICGKKLSTLKRQQEKTCSEHSQEYKKRPEHYWREHVLKQVKFAPSYIDQALKSCDKLDVFKPDLCYLTKDVAFALEFDEESHSTYEVSCELKKTCNMKDLFPNRKLVLIRMNPHPNKIVPKEYKDMAQRTDFMLELFSSILDNATQYDLSDKATNVFYLFYCKKGLKHIQEAENSDSVVIQDKLFCSN